MRAIYVRLSDQALSQLRDLAERERRHPRDQAGMILEGALREAEARDRRRAPTDAPEAVTT